MILEGDLQREWGPNERRWSRAVFIGRNLDEAALKAGYHPTVPEALAAGKKPKAAEPEKQPEQPKAAEQPKHTPVKGLTPVVPEPRTKSKK